MYGPKLDSLSSTSPATATALLLTVVTHSFGRDQELYSEVLCWILLPVIFKARLFDYDPEDCRAIPLTHNKTRCGRALSLWAVAGCVAIVSFCRAEGDSFKLMPALTPLLLTAQKSWEPRAHKQEQSSFSFLSHLATHDRSTALIAAFSILTLSNWDHHGLVFSVIAIATSFVVYAAFLNGTRNKSLWPGLPDFESCIAPLSYRVTFILLAGLAIRISIFSVPRSSILQVSILGFAKALYWCFTARTARHTSWNIAATLGSFGILSTCNTFNLSSEIQAFSFVITALITLGQIIGSIPVQTKRRSALWAFALVLLAPYLANLVISRAQFDNTPSFSQEMQHPVEALADRATGEFHDLVKRQSSTFEDACDEYQRRYDERPPPGFEEWYHFAKSHDSPLIDDFDSIHKAILPFRQLSGKQILERISQAHTVDGIDLWMCDFSGSTSTTECSHPERASDRHISLQFNKLLGNITGLPDVRFLANHLDEPRVLFPVPEGEILSHDSEIDVEDLGRQPVWDKLTKHCDHRGEASEEVENIETYGLPFVTNLSSTQNLCKHPEYGTMHGLMMSPVSFRLIQEAVPVLSTGVPSTMGDILFPSPAYMEPEFLYEEKTDVKWENKHNNLYWAGSTTGGFARNNKWQLFHRQRFVELAQNLKRKNYYLQVKDGLIQRVKSSFLNGRLFDVVFTRIFQCERKYCRHQDAYFGVKAWANKDEALRSKFAFDIDGNGISGRYYKLLASRSVPLKQTLFREWHDDRLVPWMHYIPISQSMEELPELVFYLTSTEPGRQRAKQIADSGRLWYSKAFREADRSIYVYRLMLELARLQDPKREADLS
ncbi:hypothetical protein BGZ63DRAFT_357798 [Mariannaea sp. PMI_226]|nr:hypothetical protein BGZ63DRAFT_357798 [Mariannaea sp. PMI_226]